MHLIAVSDVSKSNHQPAALDATHSGGQTLLTIINTAFTHNCLVPHESSIYTDSQTSSCSATAARSASNHLRYSAYLLCMTIAKILMLDSVAEAKLADTITAALFINIPHSRVLLRTPKPSRATVNKSSDFTACWSNLGYTCDNFRPCRSIGTSTFKITVSRLVVVIFFSISSVLIHVRTC